MKASLFFILPLFLVHLASANRVQSQFGITKPVEYQGSGISAGFGLSQDLGQHYSIEEGINFRFSEYSFWSKPGTLDPIRDLSLWDVPDPEQFTSSLSILDFSLGVSKKIDLKKLRLIGGVGLNAYLLNHVYVDTVYVGINDPPKKELIYHDYFLDRLIGIGAYSKVGIFYPLSTRYFGFEFSLSRHDKFTSLTGGISVLF